MINKVVLRQFGDPLYLAGELTKIFTEIKTYDDDKYKSLWAHNEFWEKINHVIGENDNEFRLRIARIIYEYGVKQDATEKNKEKGRRIVTGKSRREAEGNNT